MKRSPLLLGLCLFLLPLARGQDQAARRLLQRYQDLRPSADELGLYRLEWVKSLEEAKLRAAAEGRPLLLIVVRNALGDMISGHC